MKNQEDTCCAERNIEAQHYITIEFGQPLVQAHSTANARQQQCVSLWFAMCLPVAALYYKIQSK